MVEKNIGDISNWLACRGWNFVVGSRPDSQFLNELDEEPIIQLIFKKCLIICQWRSLSVICVAFSSTLTLQLIGLQHTDDPT
jgi:hypothetical protein